MTKVYSTAVVIIPPEDLWDAIQDIRKKYDRNFLKWMPHITLIHPFRPESEFKSLESSFFTICKSIKSFEISLLKINHFYHPKQNYTLWLAPEPDSLIFNLQSKLLAITPDCGDVNLFQSGFKPHLSIGQIRGNQKLTKFKKKFQETWIPFKFKTKSVHFIARETPKPSRFEIKNEFFMKRI
jgi:2'-5' RNA ligase